MPITKLIWVMGIFVKIVWLVDGIELESGRRRDRSKKVPFSIPM